MAKGGLIEWAAAGAAEGLGKQSVDVAKTQREFYNQQEHEKFKNELAAQRETALAHLREEIRRGGLQHDFNFNTDPTNVARAAAAERDKILAVAPAKAEEKRIIGAAEIDNEVKKFERMAPLQRQEAIATEVEKLKALSTPEALKASRAIALSKHIVDPSYQLIPQADGTVVTFDARSGKTGGVLKTPDGEPVVRKDPEELKAAASVINMANANLRIAQADHKASLAAADASGDAAARARADAAWALAQEEAKRITAPALAVLYGKAKIEGEPAAGPKPGTRPSLSSFGPGGGAAAAPAASGAGDVADRVLGRTPATQTKPATTASGSTPAQFALLNKGMNEWDKQPKPN